MFTSRNLFLCLFLGLAAASSALLASPARAADVTFYHIGFLPGDTYSRVNSVSDDATLADCRSYHYEGSLRGNCYAVRWTPGGGLEPLQRLADTANAGTGSYTQGARDVTVDGQRIAFIAPTLDETQVLLPVSQMRMAVT